MEQTGIKGHNTRNAAILYGLSIVLIGTGAWLSILLGMKILAFLVTIVGFVFLFGAIATKIGVKR